MELLNIVAIIGLLHSLALSGAPTLEACANDAIKDLEAKVRVDQADLTELEAINKDFGIVYRLRDVTIRYKDPDKFRLDNRLGVFIVNGARRFIHVPQLGLKKRDDIGQELSRRHSLLDLGIVTTTILQGIESRYLRDETIRGGSYPVFEVVLRGDPDRDGASRKPDSAVSPTYQLTIDPQRKYVLRRRWLNGDGKTRATFDYLEPMEVQPGIWLPTRIEVRNQANQLAGATVYRDLKINQSPSDTIFATD